MNICGTLTAGAGFDCENPLQAGTEDDLILINWNDWIAATIVRNSTDTNVIESITLPVGASGYLFQGRNNSIAPKCDLVVGTYLNNYRHEVNFKIFQISPAVKKTVENVEKGRFVAITHNRFKGVDGNAAFDILGGGSGLIASQGTREVNNVETGGAFDLIINTDDAISPEPKRTDTLFVTDYATSKALFDALLVPAA